MINFGINMKYGCYGRLFMNVLWFYMSFNCYMVE